MSVLEKVALIIILIVAVVGVSRNIVRPVDPCANIWKAVLDTMDKDNIEMASRWANVYLVCEKRGGIAPDVNVNRGTWDNR